MKVLSGDSPMRHPQWFVGRMVKTTFCRVIKTTFCSVCHDQLQQTLRHHGCQEEYADAAAMKRFESQSQQHVTQQHDEWTRKHQTQVQKFDGVVRDTDEVIQSLTQELANNKERHLQELDQALQDAERRAQQSTPVFAGTSTQPHTTPVEKKTLTAVAAVAHAEPVPALHVADLHMRRGSIWAEGTCPSNM